MPGNKFWRAALGVLSVGALLLGAGQAALSAEPTEGFTLQQCLARALETYPKLAEGRSRVAQARAQVQEAATAPFGQHRFTLGVGVAPELRGTTLLSPDRDLTVTRQLRPGVRAEVEGVLPLWTFGRIGGLQRAARAQLELKRDEQRKLQHELRAEVYEAYYSLQLAASSLALIEEVEDEMADQVAAVKVRVEGGDADASDLYELQLQRQEVAARRSQAASGLRVARAGLGFFMGLPHDVHLANEQIRPLQGPLEALEHYQRLARGQRPELAMARAGVRARKAQVEAARGSMFPSLGLAVSARVAHAPSVTDQVNPFARDVANYNRFGAGIALRGQLDFLAQRARVKQAQAQLSEVEATQRYAELGSGVEVARAFHEAVGARERLDARLEGVRVARRWWLEARQSVDLGLEDGDALAAPARHYALLRAAELQSIYELNMALVRLALKSGTIESGLGLDSEPPAER